MNLQQITPPWLRFRVLTQPPIVMAEGALIDYRLSLHGLPIRWRTEITAWQPPARFVDRQLSGPYREWHHEHTFEEHDGGTLMRDEVRYRVPGGTIVDRLLVRPDLERIFDYRQERMLELFGSPSGEGCDPPH